MLPGAEQKLFTITRKFISKNYIFCLDIKFSGTNFLAIVANFLESPNQAPQGAIYQTLFKNNFLSVIDIHSALAWLSIKASTIHRVPTIKCKFACLGVEFTDGSSHSITIYEANHDALWHIVTTRTCNALGWSWG
jgi:hypothetical protein